MSSNESPAPNPSSSNDLSRRIGLSQVLSALTETFGLTRTASIAVVLFVSVVVVSAVVWFIESAPPRTLYITSGPPGSSYQRTAERYRDILSSNGVTVKVLASGGSMENLERLGETKFQVDLGFVQAGEAANAKSPLYSLGSVAYQPLLIFYRNPPQANLLSDFAGKKLAIGPEGSGTRTLALLLLATNGITPGESTPLIDLDAETAAKGLLEGNVDAVFLMGDSASAQIMRSLLRAPGVQLFDFQQADAYTRKFGFLNKLQLPRGSIDFGKDVPTHDINLVGPTVELIAREKLHPALCDLVLEAAREVHGNATLLQRRGEFPAPLEHDFKLSPEASRYYKSGKSFLYRSLPFWVASVANRVLVAFVPMMLVLIPGLRLIPRVYKFRTQLRIYRWYRGLLRLERDLVGKLGEAKREELERRLEHIESSVNQMKVPASFAGQFYGLREHIGFVRERLRRDAGNAKSDA